MPSRAELLVCEDSIGSNEIQGQLIHLHSSYGFYIYLIPRSVGQKFFWWCFILSCNFNHSGVTCRASGDWLSRMGALTKAVTTSVIICSLYVCQREQFYISDGQDHCFNREDKIYYSEMLIIWADFIIFSYFSIHLSLLKEVLKC